MSFFQKDHSQYTIRHSQNFFKSASLANEVVNLADFNKNEYIIEIGSGKGALTKFIAPKCKSLFTIEKDNKLFKILLNIFKNETNINLINIDFLNFKLPEGTPYKIIGNIPFGLTTE